MLLKQTIPIHPILTSTVILFCQIISAQGQIIKSVYKYNSRNYSLKIPDTIAKQVPGNLKGAAIPLGNVYYTNFYSDSCSRTEIEFKENPGIKMTAEPKQAYFTNNLKQESYVLVQDEEIIKAVNYFMPGLTTTKTEDSVNGYKSNLFTYENENDILFKVWLSKDLPFSVAPGFYFKEHGGITKIEFTHKGMIWSLDLVGFNNSDDAIDLSEAKNNSTDKSKPVRFPFFDVK